MPHTAASDAIRRAAEHLLALQQPQGCWEGEMIWCPVVTAQVAITRHVVGLPFGAEDSAKILLHFARTQTPDGAFGLHPEHPGSVFVTSMVYVALRCLGASANHPLAVRARGWLHAQPGGVLSAPTWGKFWLSLLGLYGRDGLRPLVPELALLPRAIPVHPIRFYCHTRYVYLAMSLLQGSHAKFDLGPLADELRCELYGEAGPPRSFREHRYLLAPADAFEPPNLLIRAAERVMGWYDRLPVRKLRETALQRCADLIARDLDATNHLTLSPVNGVLNVLALFARGADPALVAKCVEGFEFYRFDDAARGLRYSGGRTRVWDTGFAVEALLADPHAAHLHREPLQRAYRFLAEHQMTKSVAGRDPMFPDRALGGWCLGDAAHAWPVSDCTAEALSAVLGMHTHGVAPDERIPDARLMLAADFILSRQNRDGGFGSYEKARSPRWLERLNPSEMFTRCMTDQSYVECTGSCLTALSRFRAAVPTHMPNRIDRAITRGARFLLSRQRADGAFPGAWGVYLTYGTFHAVRGLRAAGFAPDHPALQRAAGWLLQHQKPDGGWGEHYTGCLRQEYAEHPTSQATMTSWAMLALCEVVGAGHPAVKRGAEWLAAHQRGDGSFPREAVNGAFFGTAMLDYDLYRAYFPAWALAVVASSAPSNAPSGETSPAPETESVVFQFVRAAACTISDTSPAEGGADEGRRLELVDATGAVVPATVIVTVENHSLEHRAVRVRLKWAGRDLAATDYDAFDAFRAVRRQLAAFGLTPRCYGACRNLVVSGMSRQMGDGLLGYLVKLGEPARRPMVHIFDVGPDMDLVSASAQSEFTEAWFRSLGLDSTRRT